MIDRRVLTNVQTPDGHTVSVAWNRHMIHGTEVMMGQAYTPDQSIRLRMVFVPPLMYTDDIVQIGLEAKEREAMSQIDGIMAERRTF